MVSSGEGNHASEDEVAAVLAELAGHLRPVFEEIPGGVYLYLDEHHKVCNA